MRKGMSEGVRLPDVATLLSDMARRFIMHRERSASAALFPLWIQSSSGVTPGGHATHELS